MKNAIVVCGHGPGISNAVARRFGKAGYPVAIVARNGERLAAAAASLEAEGIAASAFKADLGDIESVKGIIDAIRATLGSIEILHWNAFSAVEGDLLTTTPAQLQTSFDIRVAGFLAAVQASLADLEANKGAVLATSGVMALDRPDIDAFAVDFGALAVTVAAQHKMLSILAHTLAPRSIFVGEVIVNGFVKGTEGAFERNATIEPDEVAEAFSSLLARRTGYSVVVGQSIVP